MGRAQRKRVGPALSTASRTQHVFQKYEPPLTHRPHTNLNPALCPAPSGRCRQRVNEGDKVPPRSSRSCRADRGNEEQDPNVWLVNANKEKTGRDGGGGLSGFQIGWPGGASPEADSSSHNSEVRVQLAPGAVTPKGRLLLNCPCPLRHNQHQWRRHCGPWSSRSFSSHGLHHRMESGTCGEGKRGLMLVRGADSQRQA